MRSSARTEDSNWDEALASPAARWILRDPPPAAARSGDARTAVELTASVLASWAVVLGLGYEAFQLVEALA